MVSHIVMWKFKDEIKADAFDLKMQFLHDKFVAMQGVIPGLLSIRFPVPIKKETLTLCFAACSIPKHPKRHIRQILSMLK